MNNNEKKFSIENFKKNVKQHKVKFVLNCVFLVLFIAMLIFVSVLSLSGKNNNTANAEYKERITEVDYSKYPEDYSKVTIGFKKEKVEFKASVPTGITLDCSFIITNTIYQGFDEFYYIMQMSNVYSDGKYYLNFSGFKLGRTANGERINIRQYYFENGQFITVIPTPDFIDSYRITLVNPTSTNIANDMIKRLSSRVEAYEIGYNYGESTGFEKGEIQGYDLGYSSGYNTALTDKFTNPVNSILQPVSAFLETNLFGGVSIGSILSVAIFVGLALIFIKMFAGG